MKKKHIKRILVSSASAIMIFSAMLGPKAFSDSTVRIEIDGKELITKPNEPVSFIENDRTLVPIYFISEELGAEVIWNNDERTVEIIKDDRKVLLTIDSYLVEYEIDNETIYNLSDVAPKIVGDRTFVPIRLVSNALGVGVDWNNDSRTVVIDSSIESRIEPFFDVKLTSLENGQVITGTTQLQTEVTNVLDKAAEIKYLLLNPDTAKGFIIAKGTELGGTYEWLPTMEDQGEKILVAAIYDAQGKFISGDSIGVNVDIVPNVELKGLEENQLIVGGNNYPLTVELNFSPAYVKYEFVKDGVVIYTSTELDPIETFNMVPVVEDNGTVSVRVIAYDMNDNPYPSKFINYRVNVEPSLSLGGVSEGKIINNSVSLSARRNFNVIETEFIMKDLETGDKTILKTIPYGNYTWFPGPEFNGNKELYVKVKDTKGEIYTSPAIKVNVQTSPQLMLQGVGPNQVVTGNTNLSVKSNVLLDSVKYILINNSTGSESVLYEGANTNYNFIPVDGAWSIRAEAMYSGNKLKSEEVSFTVYTGQTYSARPIVEKSKFIDMASELAKDTWKETGMSASLQVAQAILETGWGQLVPVDKYDGQFSNNLFGIKGIGTAGSVTSNTWEEYNGISYRIDADFRAYNNVKESWDDHHDLLLTKSRYQIFTDVMFDSTQGAWALRRAGYATDSKYPMKLMEIIYINDLKQLDEVGI